MKMIKLVPFVLLFSLFACTANGGGDKGSSSKYILSGYMPEHSMNLTAESDLSYLKIPTRIYYFGIYPDGVGDWKLSSDTPAKLITVKAAMKPSQELFMVAGGGATATHNMHVMGRNPEKRTAYAAAIVKFAHDNNFDGIDIDWETDWVPVPPMHVEVADFVDLITKVRANISALPSGTKVKKLTVALGSRTDSQQMGAAISELVDQINVMIYDNYGTEQEGYPHAPMYLFTKSLSGYVAAGVPKSKLLAGVPFYGGNKRVSPTATMPYRKLYDLSSGAITANMNSFDDYAFNGAQMMTQKAQYVIDNGYAGIMIWELTHDVPYDNPLSLLRALETTLNQ